MIKKVCKILLICYFAFDSDICLGVSGIVVLYPMVCNGPVLYPYKQKVSVPLPVPTCYSKHGIVSLQIKG